MIRLYQSSGSGEIVFASKIDDDQWSKFRTLSKRMLFAQGKVAASELLDKYPFSLHEGSNFFGDEFHYLNATFKVEDYVKIAEEESAPERGFLWRSIAEVITEVSPYYIRFIVIDVNRDEDTPTLVETPVLPTSAEKVNEALADAEQLLRSRSASSAIDRLHTAFHGYLQEQCRTSGIAFKTDDSITTLYKKLREEHKTLKEEISKHDEIKRICNALAAIIDSLNPIRNRLSRAHPNESIISEDEAFLVINIIRSLFHYLNAKL